MRWKTEDLSLSTYGSFIAVTAFAFLKWQLSGLGHQLIVWSWVVDRQDMEEIAC